MRWHPAASPDGATLELDSTPSRRASASASRVRSRNLATFAGTTGREAHRPRSFSCSGNRIPGPAQLGGMRTGAHAARALRHRRNDPALLPGRCQLHHPRTTARAAPFQIHRRSRLPRPHSLLCTRQGNLRLPAQTIRSMARLSDSRSRSTPNIPPSAARPSSWSSSASAPRGYALDRGEHFDGIHCVAAPLLDRHGHTDAAAISHRRPCCAHSGQSGLRDLAEAIATPVVCRRPLAAEEQRMKLPSLHGLLADLDAAPAWPQLRVWSRGYTPVTPEA